jgi:hypothetical protein
MSVDMEFNTNIETFVLTLNHFIGLFVYFLYISQVPKEIQS